MIRTRTMAALSAAALLAAANGAAAQERAVELRFSLWVPPSHANVKSAGEWGESIAKASNGSIKVAVFPAEQLGKAFDHYDMAKSGIVDVAFLSLGYEPGRLPIAAISQVPFLMANAKGGSRALDEWYRKYAPRDMPEVKFCLGYAHDPGTFHAKKKIVVPEDIKGMKIRPAHATMGNFVTMLGGTTVQGAAPQVREILERGVADAVTFPWASVYLFGFQNAVKFHMDVPLYVATFGWIINTAKYNAMSPAQKKVIDDHCTPEWAGRVADPWVDQEAAGRTRMLAEPGHEVYKLSDAEVAAWKKAAEPLRTQWADNVRKTGIDPAAVLGDLETALKKHGALY